MRGQRKPAGLPIDEALHPVAIAAVALLVVNDWVLKPSAAPGWLTGKLSDLAGLVFAPLVLSALIGLALRAPVTTRRLAGVIAATGAVFAAVKLSPAIAHAIASVWPAPRARIVADPTDLVCLPALAIPWWIGHRTIRRRLAACVPTS